MPGGPGSLARFVQSSLPKNGVSVCSKCVCVCAQFRETIICDTSDIEGDDVMENLSTKRTN